MVDPPAPMPASIAAIGMPSVVVSVGGKDVVMFPRSVLIVAMSPSMETKVPWMSPNVVVMFTMFP